MPIWTANCRRKRRGASQRRSLPTRALSARLEAQRRLRARLGAAFDSIASAPVPAGIAALPGSANVVGIGSARFEIESSRMAVSQGASDDVKTFARHMIDAHTQSTANLKQAVSNVGGISAPDGAHDPMMKEKLDSLRSLQGAEFDKTYSAEQVAAHQNALKMLRDYAASGTDPVLKVFASETAPVVEEHLEKARGLNR